MNLEDINDKNFKEIMRTYETAYTEITKQLKQTLNYNKNPLFKTVSHYVIDKYVEQRLQQLSRDLKVVVPSGIDTAFSIAYTEALAQKHIEQGIKNINLEELLKEAPTVMKNGKVATSLGEVTMQDLLQITRNTEYAVKKLIRETFSKHMTVQTMIQKGRKDLANKIIKDLTGKKLDNLIEQNITAIVDRAGRRWNVNTYVDMAVKTKYHQAHVEGIKQFVQDYNGYGDLARIPVKKDTVDACKAFEGMIISMTGATAGYKTYNELKATGLIFHPRCRHNPVSYWNESSIPKSTLQQHKRISKKADKIMDNL